VGSKNGFNHRQINLKIKAIFGIHNSNENTTDLYSSLIKTVNVNVLESNNNRKLSDEKVNVLKASGEGRFF
jgi:hypothetical protein